MLAGLSAVQKLMC